MKNYIEKPAFVTGGGHKLVHKVIHSFPGEALSEKKKSIQLASSSVCEFSSLAGIRCFGGDGCSSITQILISETLPVGFSPVKEALTALPFFGANESKNFFREILVISFLHGTRHRCSRTIYCSCHRCRPQCCRRQVSQSASSGPDCCNGACHCGRPGTGCLFHRDNRV